MLSDANLERYVRRWASTSRGPLLLSHPRDFESHRQGIRPTDLAEDARSFELLEPPPGTETQRGTVEPYRPPAPLGMSPASKRRYDSIGQ